MCGGAFNEACADCAEACELTARTKAAANAASFAFDIFFLLPLFEDPFFGWAHSRAVQLERRATRRGVEDISSGGSVRGIHPLERSAEPVLLPHRVVEAEHRRHSVESDDCGGVGMCDVVRVAHRVEVVANVQ